MKDPFEKPKVEDTQKNSGGLFTRDCVTEKKAI